MAVHITGTASVPISAGNVRGLRLTVNTGFTGTITTTDGTGVIAIVTTPVAGNSFLYSGLLGPVSVQNSAAGDVTASILSNHG